MGLGCVLVMHAPREGTNSFFMLLRLSVPWREKQSDVTLLSSEGYNEMTDHISITRFSLFSALISERLRVCIKLRDLSFSPSLLQSLLADK